MAYLITGHNVSKHCYNSYNNHLPLKALSLQIAHNNRNNAQEKKNHHQAPPKGRPIGEFRVTSTERLQRFIKRQTGNFLLEPLSDF